MKHNSTVIALGMIFFILLGVFFLQERALQEDMRRPTIEPTAILTRIFPEMAVIDIDAIRLQDPINDAYLTIARDANDAWVFADGREGQLDQQTATLIARTMVLLPYRESFTIDNNTDLEQYGFRPTGDFIILILMNDGTEHSVAIGDPTLSSPTFYGVVDDRDEVYLIERPAIDFLVNHFINPPVVP